MRRTNPEYACVYFHASWNPYMKHINAQHEKICAKYSSFYHVWVDTDKLPTIKFHYDVQTEPSFVMLIHGCEIGRIVGDDFQQLETLYERHILTV